MFKPLITRLLFAILLIPLSCSSIQAAEKPAPTGLTAGATVVHAFASKNEIKRFAALFNSKGATINRITMLKGYLSAEMQNNQRVNEQLLSRYKIRSDRNYIFDAKRKIITEQAMPGSQDKTAREVYRFTSNKKIQQFINDKQLKEATNTRINVLQGYLKGEETRLAQINAQLLKQYHIESGKNYRFEPKKMRLISAAASPTASVAQPSNKKLVVSVSIGNVRSEPSRNGKVLFKLKKGTVVTVLSRQGDWIQIRMNGGQTAWAYHSIF